MIDLSQTLMSRISPEDELLFACTRQNFLRAHQRTVLDICGEHEVDWESVYQTASLHGVAPLIYANLQQCNPLSLGIPEKVIDQFKLCYYRNIISKERRAEKLKRALALFDRQSIEVMLIKGAALDILVYDQPWYTTSHDLDLVIRAKRDQIPDKIVREIGQFFDNDGMEYDYFEHHDVTMNGVLPVDFQKIWNDATKIKFEGRDVFVMSPEDMLLSLCINSCRKRFFRLKALGDIAETINEYPDLDWTELVQKARAYDCHNIVYAALLITKMAVGCSLPAGVFDALNVKPVRAKVIHYLSQRMSLSSFSSLYSGINLFGRKTDWSLFLSYATFQWYQIRRRMAFVLSFTGNGERKAGIRSVALPNPRP